MGGKSNDVTIGYWYQMDVLATLCHGPIDELVEIRVGDRVAWSGLIDESQTISIYKNELFGGEKREGGVYGQVDAMFGESAQPVNEFLGTSMLKSGLTGPVPAYRGTTNLFFRGAYSADTSFPASGVFVKQASLPPFLKSSVSFLSSTGLLGNKRTPSPSAFRWTAMNPGFKPFRCRARRYTKDWQPLLAKIVWETSNELVVNIDYSARNTDSAHNGLGYFDGINITGVSPNETLRVTKRLASNGGAYQAWSIWDTDVGHATPWNNKFSVRYPTVDEGVYTYTTHLSTSYATAADAESAASSFELLLTGYSSYKIGIIDSAWADNRGGLSLTVERYADGVDMNPAHIIRECLTNSEWGMGYPSADLDDVRFQAVAQALYDEGFGLSLKWSQQTTIADFIKSICQHINGLVSQDRTTGKLFPKLIRDDYVVGSLLLLDPSNCVLESYSRASSGEIVNEVTAKYTKSDGKSDSITVHDLASATSSGQIISQEIDLPGLRNPELVARVAQRELESRIKPIAKLSISANRAAYSLYEGDVFKFSWPAHGIAEMVCRVVSMDMGNLQNNIIRIEAVQDVFGLPATSYIKPQTSGWVDASGDATASPLRYITETPYYDIARTMSAADLAYLDPTDCYLNAYIKAPTNGALSYALWTAAGSADLQERTIGNYVAMTTLATNLVKEETSVIELADVSAIAYLIESDNACLIINGEYMHITDYDEDAGTVSVDRGVLDTLPGTHSIGATVILADNSAGQDGISYIPTEVVKLRAQTRTARGNLPIEDTPEDTYTVLQRQARPYPPARLRVNGTAYPATISVAASLGLIWKHRNRLTQTATIIDQDTGTITPEVGTTYNLRIYGPSGALLRSVTGITAEAYEYTTFQETSDSGLLNSQLRFELEANRDGLVSWQKYNHTVDRPGAGEGGGGGGGSDPFYYPKLYDGTYLVGKGDYANNPMKIVYSSDDGATWTVSSNSIGFVPLHLVRGLGLYVAAVNSWFGVASSPSGTWTSATVGSDYVSDLIFDGTRFIGTRNDKILTSTDGVTWTNITHNLIGLGQIKKIHFFNSNYFVVFLTTAGLFKIYKSSDRVTWTVCYTNPVGASIGDVSDANGVLLGMGSKTVSFKERPFLVKSLDDGATWTDVSPVTSTTNPLGMIVNGMSFIGTNYVTLGTFFEAYSSDLSTWTINEPSLPLAYSSDSVISGSNLFTTRENNYVPELVYTTNGVSWTVIPT